MYHQRLSRVVLSLVAVAMIVASLAMLGCADEDDDVRGLPSASLDAIRSPISSVNAAAMVGRTFSFSARAFNSENAPFVVDVTFLTAPTTITTPATATAGGLLTGGTFRAVRVVDGATATGTWATIIPPTNAALPVAANMFFVVAAAAGGTSTFGAGTGLGLNEGVACTSSTFCSLLITVNAPCNGKTVDIAASMGMSFGPQAVVNAAIPGVTVGGQVVVTSSPITTVAQTAPPVAVPMVIDANGNVLVSQGRLATGVEAECR